ncbi:VanZ family protein [Ornithinimicrobium panacihumi]|uniref:VanZ family protein n=1 Tax=Ornithinimicrobium panacihumi TaxID=2008449 RepID=UPI003F8982C1
MVLVVLVGVQLYGLYADTVPGPEAVSRLDKVNHLLGFGVPAALAWALRARWLVAAMVGHALVSELVQSWVAPLRMPDVLDTVANLVGILVGVLLVEVVRRARRPRSAMMEP